MESVFGVILRKLYLSRGYAIIPILLMILGILFSFFGCGRILVLLFDEDSPWNDNPSRHEQLCSRTDADLRSIATALEMYNIDNNAFPRELHVLTSPLDYMSSIPEDPFAPGEEFRWTPEAVDDKLYLWSVGPDEIDSEGRIVYDPTNGTVSAGDIVRVVRDIRISNDPALLRCYRAYDYFSSGEHAEKFSKITKDFSYISDLINFYIGKYGEPPQFITDLPQGLDTVSQLPFDPYTSGRDYGYIITEVHGVLLLYSIGPDGYDNGGDQLYEGGDPPGGDIVFTLNVEIPETGKDKKQDEDSFLAELLKLKEETGLDNAMIYYQQAGQLELSIPDGELMDNILRNGWTEGSNELLMYIELYQPAFELIREGNAVGHTAYPDPSEKGFATPIPNFLNAQVSAKMLCAEARLFESQGEYDRALDDYLTALQMGRNYGGENAFLISGLISVAIENIALERIIESVESGVYSDLQLQQIADALRETGDAVDLHTECIKSEYAGSVGYFSKDQEEYLRVRTDAELYKEFLERKGIPMEESVMLYGTGYIEVMEDYYNAALEELGKPYWERDYKKWQEIEEETGKKHPLARIAIPNFWQSGVRCEVSDLKAHLAGTAAALERFKADNGHYPWSLEAVPKYYLPELPVDPFSGRTLGYAGDAVGYKLYGIGPDGQDNLSTITYDPTNGSMSAGDIIVGSGL